MAGSDSGLSGGERILQAASDLFATRPYHEVGVAEVLEKSGVKAPTLYHHFGEKEGLYLAWAERAFQQLGKAIRDRARVESDPRQALVGLLQTVSGFRGLDVIEVVRSAPRVLKPASTERVLQAYFDAVYEPCCVALLNAADAGLLKLDDIGRTAGIFLMSGLGASRRYALPATSSGDEIEWAVDRFLRAFAP